jgi:hypothetical protein
VPAALHIVIVHRDQPERCAQTVAAFRAQRPDATITVVDNGSGPAEAGTLRALLEPDTAEILHAGENLGFGPGANAALRRWLAGGSGEWVVIAPHDAVPQPGCLDLLLAEATARSDAGLISAEFGPDFEFVPAIDWVIGGYYRPSPRGSGWQEVDYPHGTLLLARRGTLEDIGLFDERYFAYCEEVDLALRARAAGWRVGLVWGAVVSNSQLPARAVADYLQVRNTLLLVRERFGRYPAGVRCVLAGFGALGRAIREPRRAFVHFRLEGRAIADYLRGRFGPPPPEVWSLAASNRA